MKKKYGCVVICNICNKEIDTGLCYTKLGRWVKTKILLRKHWHTKAEVMFKEATGIYYPTTEKEWEKEG